MKFHGYDCNVVKSRYGNGRIALLLEDAVTGEPIAKATVNVPEEPLHENEVVIKDYSENVGMADVLIEAGLVAPTGHYARVGFVTCPICEVLI